MSEEICFVTSILSLEIELEIKLFHMYYEPETKPLSNHYAINLRMFFPLVNELSYRPIFQWQRK